jgi:UDP-N-acetylmuramyl tripeptide synthase
VATGIGGVVAGLSRRLRRGGGSVVGGRAILAVDPDALHRLAAGRPVALVSGTNGKTTTTSLLRAALTTMGPVLTNVQGANLPPGLTAALARGPLAAAAALEVDEAWLGRVVEATEPRALALLNLSRDQLDRNNEVRQLAATWRRTLAQRPGTTVVANADDPLVVWGAGAAAQVCWVGAGQPWTLDASGCPSCGSRIRFDSEGWSCRECELRRPPLDVRLVAPDRQGELPAIIGPGGRHTDLRLSLPGRANQANAAMALTVAGILGADPARAAAAMSEVAEVVGRYAVVEVGGRQARLLLAKNPAGWLEVFDFLRPPPLPVVVVINARIADGRDPSWLWDVPFERLAGRLVVASGERSRDLAVRLHYANVEHVHVPDPVLGVAATGAPRVDVVANYTSFQALRARLA